MFFDNFCATKAAAEQLALKRGLLEPGSSIQCAFALTCLGLTCLQAENPRYRTMYLPQQGVNSVPSGLDRFYNKLIGHFRIVDHPSR